MQSYGCLILLLVRMHKVVLASALPFRASVMSSGLTTTLRYLLIVNSLIGVMTRRGGVSFAA